MNIPVMMMTAEQDPKLSRDSFAAGAVVFLPKPLLQRATADNVAHADSAKRRPTLPRTDRCPLSPSGRGWVRVRSIATAPRSDARNPGASIMSKRNVLIIALVLVVISAGITLQTFRARAICLRKRPVA